MTTDEAKSRIVELRALIEKANRDYYELHQPTVGDRDYDLWEKELLALEEEFPQFASADSPVRNVASDITEGFAKVRHDPPMQSLDKTHSFDELRTFDDFITRSITGFTYLVEPKIDGISLSLRYSGRRLVRAATRGNGTIGDDITANVMTIASVPKTLPDSAPAELEVRGEAYMTRDGFVLLNEKLASEGKEEFANPRNACAGSLKQLDSKVTAERPLDVVIYNAGGVGCDGFASHSEMIAAFAKWGFPVAPWSRFCHDIEEVFAAINELGERRHTFRFEIDGAVIKIDERKFYELLGATAHGPRWARAFKYAPERAETVIESITVQVGRTGILTPVAELRPTELAGSVISRATLHNADQIARQDVRVGDHVWLVKAGDVIPAIDSVIVEKRDGSEKVFVMPDRCPVCGGETRREEEEVAIRCVNPSCPAQLCRRLEHFASRNALDLKTLGGKLAEIFVEKGIVKDPLDLFTLDYDNLRNLDVSQEQGMGNGEQGMGNGEEGMGNGEEDLFAFAEKQSAGRKFGKNADNLREAVAASKTLPLSRWIYAMGIPSVGVTTAKKIASGELVPSEDVKLQIEAWLERLAKLGITPTEPKREVKAEGPLVGAGCVLTGTLSRPREEYAKLIEAAGGIVQSAVTRKTKYLIAGENTGATKTEKAKKLGTEVIDEERLKELLNG